MDFKVLIARNISNNVFINKNSVMKFYIFENFKKAKTFVDDYINKNKNIYIKIWNIKTNEILFEKTIY